MFREASRCSSLFEKYDLSWRTNVPVVEAGFEARINLVTVTETDLDERKHLEGQPPSNQTLVKQLGSWIERAQIHLDVIVKTTHSYSY